MQINTLEIRHFWDENNSRVRMTCDITATDLDSICQKVLDVCGYVAENEVLAELQGRIDELNETCNNYMNLLTMTQAHLSEAQDTIDGMDRIIKDMQVESGKKDDEAVRLSDEVRLKQRQIDSLEHVITGQDSEYQTASADITRLTEKLAECQLECLDHKKTIEVLNSKVRLTQTNEDELVARFAVLKHYRDRLEECEMDCLEVLADNERLVAENKELLATVKHLRDSLGLP